MPKPTPYDEALSHLENFEEFTTTLNGEVYTGRRQPMGSWWGLFDADGVEMEEVADLNVAMVALGDHHEDRTGEETAKEEVLKNTVAE